MTKAYENLDPFFYTAGTCMVFHSFDIFQKKMEKEKEKKIPSSWVIHAQD
jgi:hypothetical protein